MPDHRRRTPHPLAVTATISRAALAKLDARARLQGLSRAQALRSLVEALPAPTDQAPTPHGGDTSEESTHG
jgi:hypothetical protein